MGVYRPLRQPEGLLWGQASRCPGGWVPVELARAWRSRLGMPATTPLLPVSQAAGFVHAPPLGLGGGGTLSTRPRGASAPDAPGKLSPSQAEPGPLQNLRSMPGINQDSVIGLLFFHFATS